MTRAESMTSRERYEKVLRVVEYQTGTPRGPSPQPPAASLQTVLAICCEARDPDAELYHASVRAAVANTDLIKFTDQDDTVRVARATPEALRAVTQWAAERDTPDKQVVALANQALSHITDTEPA